MVQAASKQHGVVPQLVELQNLVGSGAAILQAALARRNSRGAHFCADFPSEARDKAAELTRLLGQTAEAPAPSSLAALVPAAQGPSLPLRMNRGSGRKGLFGGRRVVPGPPPNRSLGFKRSPSWSRSTDSAKTWAVDAVPEVPLPEGLAR